MKKNLFIFIFCIRDYNFSLKIFTSVSTILFNKKSITVQFLFRFVWPQFRLQIQKRIKKNVCFFFVFVDSGHLLKITLTNKQ